MSETVSNEALFERRKKAVPQGPFHVGAVFAAEAKGAQLWDVEGKRYIDFCGGIGVLNVGHNHPKVVQAVKNQADKFLHTCWHVAMYEEYLRLAERLNALYPGSADTVMTTFFNSGAEAGENAVKIARAATGRTGVVCVERGFHGRTLLGMSMTGKVKPYSAGFGPFAPEVYRMPYQPLFDLPEAASEDEIRAGAERALQHLFQYHLEPESIACVILEPVLGEGGFFPIHPVAAKTVRKACADHGILYVSDEVQSGFGRCGSLFACERYDLDPDMVMMAKSLAGGLPLSGVSGKAEYLNAPGVGGIGGTYGGNPLACAAANAVLDIIEEEGLCERAEEIGQKVMTTFSALTETVGHVGRARGLGAMCGLEIVHPESGAPDPERTNTVIARAREKGVLIMSASGNVLRTLMPLVISDCELDEALGILSEVITSAS